MNTISLLCGFLVIFTGVYLLNLSREDPEGNNVLSNTVENGVPTDGMASMQTRRSLQLRRSIDGGHYRGRSSSNISFAHAGDRERLIHSYETDNQQFGLDDLAEESDDGMNGKRTSFDKPEANGRTGHGPRRSPRSPAYS